MPAGIVGAPSLNTQLPTPVPFKKFLALMLCIIFVLILVDKPEIQTDRFFCLLELLANSQF